MSFGDPLTLADLNIELVSTDPLSNSFDTEHDTLIVNGKPISGEVLANFLNTVGVEPCVEYPLGLKTCTFSKNSFDHVLSGHIKAHVTPFAVATGEKYEKENEKDKGFFLHTPEGEQAVWNNWDDVVGVVPQGVLQEQKLHDQLSSFLKEHPIIGVALEQTHTWFSGVRGVCEDGCTLIDALSPYYAPADEWCVDICKSTHIEYLYDPTTVEHTNHYFPDPLPPAEVEVNQTWSPGVGSRCADGCTSMDGIIIGREYYVTVVMPEDAGGVFLTVPLSELSFEMGIFVAWDPPQYENTTWCHDDLLWGRVILSLVLFGLDPCPPPPAWTDFNAFDGVNVYIADPVDLFGYEKKDLCSKDSLRPNSEALYYVLSDDLQGKMLEYPKYLNLNGDGWSRISGSLPSECE